MFVTARHYHGVSHCLGVQVPCWVADQGSDRPAVPVLAAPPPWFPALSCQRECPPGDRIRAAPPAPARQRGPGTLKQPSSPASSSGFRHPDLGRGQTGAVAGGHGVAQVLRKRHQGLAAALTRGHGGCPTDQPRHPPPGDSPLHLARPPSQPAPFPPLALERPSLTPALAVSPGTGRKRRSPPPPWRCGP